MADRVQSYPPVGDPDRFDAIVRRGRSMRRRRQLGVGAGAGGAVLAAVFGVVLMVGTDAGNDDVIADSTGETTTSTTSTTTIAPLPDTMTVEIDLDSGTVTVIDPEQPGVDDAEQCLSVWITDHLGMDVAQGYACNGSPGDADATLEVVPVDPMLGQTTTCATSENRARPGTTPVPDPRPATSNFELELPALAPGEYTVDAQATSGRGDGCPGSSDDSDEIEHEASAAPTALLVP